VAAPFAQIRLDYRNPSSVTRVVDLYVNGQTVTRVAFPSTGSAAASVWIQAKLDRAAKNNVLNFAVDAASGVSIESIHVH
jgi:hypothetical protein